MENKTHNIKKHRYSNNHNKINELKIHHLKETPGLDNKIISDDKFLIKITFDIKRIRKS